MAEAGWCDECLFWRLLDDGICLECELKSSDARKKHGAGVGKV